MRPDEISRFEQAALVEVFADDLERGWIPSDADLREALEQVRGSVAVETRWAG